MKKFILGFVLGAIIFRFTAIFAEEVLRILPNPYPVLVDGTKHDIQAYNINDYTYLKLADVGNILGTKVIFNQTDSQIEIASPTTNDIIGNIENLTPKDLKQLRNNIDSLIYKEDLKVNSEEIKITPDGIKAFYFEGEWYIYITTPNEKWMDDHKKNNTTTHYQMVPIALENKEYSETAQLYKYINNNSELIFDNIQLNIVKNKECIKYDYYVNTILPLIQSHNESVNSNTAEIETENTLFLSSTVQFDQSDKALKIIDYNDEKWIGLDSIRDKIHYFYYDGSYDLFSEGNYDNPQIKIVYKNKDYTHSEKLLDVFGTVIINDVEDEDRKLRYIKYDDWKNIVLPELKTR